MKERKLRIKEGNDERKENIEQYIKINKLSGQLINITEWSQPFKNRQSCDAKKKELKTKKKERNWKEIKKNELIK